MQSEQYYKITLGPNPVQVFYMLKLLRHNMHKVKEKFHKTLTQWTKGFKKLPYKGNA